MAGIDDNYVDVATRISEFKAKHPQGCLRPLDPARPFWVEAVGPKLFVVYAAAAYRTPDDELPGIGLAWEPFPGPTAFTRDSELQNAETAAWGRAIIAVLAASSSKRIASTEEVRNRSGVDPNSGEVAGGSRGGAPTTTTPASTGTKRRPPPRQPAGAAAPSQREEGRSETRTTSSAGEGVSAQADGRTTSRPAGEKGDLQAGPPPATDMVEAAMRAVLKQAQRKGLDVAEVADLAGKALETVTTIEEVNTISQLVATFGAKG